MWLVLHEAGQRSDGTVAAEFIVLERFVGIDIEVRRAEWHDSPRRAIADRSLVSAPHPH